MAADQSAVRRHRRELIVRAAPTFSDAALGPTRAPFTGSWRQIADDDELVDTALGLAGGAITTIVA
jgi:hypothetical protein